MSFDWVGFVGMVFTLSIGFTVDVIANLFYLGCTVRSTDHKATTLRSVCGYLD